MGFLVEGVVVLERLSGDGFEMVWGFSVLVVGVLYVVWVWG